MFEAPNNWTDILGSVNTIARSFDHITKVSRSVLAAEEDLRRYRHAAAILGESGWTLPMWYSAAGMPDFLEGIEADDDYDGAFEDYYHSENDQEFRSLTRELQSNHLLKRWHSLLAECSSCYLCGHYRVVVPALLSVFEGELAAVLKTTKTRLIKPSAQMRDASHFATDLLKWASVTAFVSDLFEPQTFDGPEPKRINRHWVLHGRTSANWQRVDALRLFHAIHTVGC